MIKINLLPVKKTKRQAGAKRELLLYLIIALLAVVAVSYLYIMANDRLEETNQKIVELNARLEADKKAIGDTPEQEKHREALKQQLAVLTELQNRRSGPVRVLDELQEILSPPRNREASLIQAQKNWNVDWDPRRLWLDKLTETNGAFTMTGSAESADDVAEFMRRLESAEHFNSIQLQFVAAKAASSRSNGVNIPRMVQFSLSGIINYAPKKKVEELAPTNGGDNKQEPNDASKGGTQ